VPRRSLADLSEMERFDMLRARRLLLPALHGAKRVPVHSLLDMFVAAGARDESGLLREKGLQVRGEEFLHEGLVMLTYDTSVTDGSVDAERDQYYLADAGIERMLALIARQPKLLDAGEMVARGTLVMRAGERMVPIAYMKGEQPVVRLGVYKENSQETWPPRWRFLTVRRM